VSKITLTVGELTLTVEDPDGIQAAIVLDFAVRNLTTTPHEPPVTMTVGGAEPINWDAYADKISHALARHTMLGGAA
jgi:hypothetical protein